jgi:hypothetical protein
MSRTVILIYHGHKPIDLSSIHSIDLIIRRTQQGPNVNIDDDGGRQDVCIDL